MAGKFNTIITGTGSFIPESIVKNSDFLSHEFYDDHYNMFDTPGEEIVEKFESITGIYERRYVNGKFQASDIGAIAGRQAIENAEIDQEEIDQIIVAHNFGDIIKNTFQTDILPSLASRVKHALGIKNPDCVAYDILFGCPGWVQGVIQADAYIKAGMAKTCLVIGAETLSRVLDPHDRDSMIFSDGAGAAIVEKEESDNKRGILATAAMSFTEEEAFYLSMGRSNKPNADPNVRYIKMNGRKIYEFALTNVPQAMKCCLDKANVDISDIKKVFIHQANEKMDEAIIKRFYRLYQIRDLPEDIMPMSIDRLGNSSVATVPTLFDLVKRNKLNGHSLDNGDIVLLASVGAGMNINSVIYKN